MKDYGRDGRDGHLKSEKKKKRKFEVIMNTGMHGIYSDFTLRKVAKKATINLARKKKHIIFHLREKEKSEKIYGPYIGYIKDGKTFSTFSLCNISIADAPAYAPISRYVIFSFFIMSIFTNYWYYKIIFEYNIF